MNREQEIIKRFKMIKNIVKMSDDFISINVKNEKYSIGCAFDDIRLLVNIDCEDEFDEFDEGNSQEKDEERLFVNSSWIDYFIYNFTKKELTISTDGGRIWTYISVPEELWYDLKEKDALGGSIGAFYNDNIKGVYDRKYKRRLYNV